MSEYDTVMSILTAHNIPPEDFDPYTDEHRKAYEELYDYYVFKICAMPYPIAKARIGNPFRWIAERVERVMEDVKTNI